MLGTTSKSYLSMAVAIDLLDQNDMDEVAESTDT